MILPALAIYFVLEGIIRRKRYDTGIATGGPPELPVPRPARICLTTVAAVNIGFTIILYGAVVVGSFVRIRGVDNTFTLAWYTTGGGSPNVFIQSMTSLSAIVFLISPGNELAAVAIFHSAYSSYYGVSCAMSVTMLAGHDRKGAVRSRRDRRGGDGGEVREGRDGAREDPLLP